MTEDPLEQDALGWLQNAVVELVLQQAQAPGENWVQ